jgi:iron complex outermembrane receptor protein
MGNPFIPVPITESLEYEKKYTKVDISSIIGQQNFLLGLEISSITKNNSTNDRKSYSMYLHDTITIDDNIMLSIGGRYDNFDDQENSKVSSSFSPRVALVYDADTINIFKLQYAKSFRMPTFLEQEKGAKAAEKNEMLEAQYIYKTVNKNFKSTAFYSTINSLIYSEGALNYKNSVDDILNYGLELEYTQNFDNEFLFTSNVSYVKAKYKDNNKELMLYAPILANVSLSYKPYSKFSSTLKVRYIDSKKREELDTRDDFTSQTSVDIAFRYLPTHVKDIDLTFGIKNILDKDLKNPSKVYIDRKGGATPKYENDLSISSRYYFVGIDYKF